MAVVMYLATGWLVVHGARSRVRVYRQCERSGAFAERNRNAINPGGRAPKRLKRAMENPRRIRPRRRTAPFFATNRRQFAANDWRLSERPLPGRVNAMP
jgi:hypothetical protein